MSKPTTRSRLRFLSPLAHRIEVLGRDSIGAHLSGGTLMRDYHTWIFIDRANSYRPYHPLRFLSRKVYGVEDPYKSKRKGSPLAHLKSRRRDFHLAHFESFDAEGMPWKPLLCIAYLPSPNGLGDDWTELALEAIQGDLQNPRHESVKAWESYWLNFVGTRRNRRALKAMMA